MTLLPVRLQPGSDLRLALEQVLARRGEQAGFVVSGIGSLSRACLRLAGQETVSTRQGDFEVLSLAGSLSPDGAHLHICVADAQGRVIGGHLGVGSLVRTTAEVLVLRLPQWTFRRGLDPLTGARELQIEPREAL